jgi:excisionase family DNA binding protein
MVTTAPELLTVQELAHYLRVSLKTAYQLVSGGEIPAAKVGGQWRIRRAEVDRLLAEQSASG